MLFFLIYIYFIHFIYNFEILQTCSFFSCILEDDHQKSPGCDQGGINNYFSNIIPNHYPYNLAHFN